MATRAKPDAGGNRIPLMVRTAPALRAKLEAAAAESGRSLAQEAELRLERSFELVSIIDKTIERTLDKAFESTKEAMSQVESNVVALAGGDDLFMLWPRLSLIIQEIEYETGKTIRGDEFTKNKAEKEILGAIPDLFRRLPQPYSVYKERATVSIKDGARSNALAALSSGEAGLPPLGHVGQWPPKTD